MLFSKQSITVITLSLLSFAKSANGISSLCVSELDTLGGNATIAEARANVTLDEDASSFSASEGTVAFTAESAAALSAACTGASGEYSLQSFKIGCTFKEDGKTLQTTLTWEYPLCYGTRCNDDDLIDLERALARSFSDGGDFLPGDGIFTCGSTAFSRSLGFGVGALIAVTTGYLL